MIARAKKLDPKLAKIYLAEEELLPRSMWRERQAAVAAGLAANPGDASLHAAMSFELSQVGLQNESIASARRAVELDPASPVVRADLIQILNFSGRTAEAEAELQKAEKIWPVSTTLRDARYAFDLRVGDPVRALRMLHEDQSLAGNLLSKSRVPQPGIEPFLQARINPTPANISRAIEVNRKQFSMEPSAFGPTLLAFASFDRTDDGYAIFTNPDALRILPNASGLLFRSYFKKFRQDPRFMPLAARIGLVRLWSETGKWPDFCFEPDLPYDCKVEAAKLKAAGQVR